MFEEVGVVAGFAFGEGAEDVGEFAAVPAAGFGEEVVEEVGEGFFFVGAGGIERGAVRGYAGAADGGHAEA